MTSSDSISPGAQEGREPADVAGYVDRSLPRWVLVLAAVVYVAWLGFLLAMVVVRMIDPHYMAH